ncbi:hypothetical protein RRG08_006667 [Elysia crispata]|uniref:Solute carrier family 23 member 1 n=1 Tax=Elysia crispata TaxID=231223 RepID=A0AAE0YW18_9GAST|nr:hypothetical protein RRG08_006667 [Elysia crispata]
MPVGLAREIYNKTGAFRQIQTIPLSKNWQSQILRSATVLNLTASDVRTDVPIFIKIPSHKDNTPETGEMADEERCGQKDNLIEQKDTGFQGKNDNIELVEKVALHKSMTVKIEDKSSPLELQYGLRSYPPVLITLMAALQHILLCLSSALATSQVVADSACAPYDHPVRSQLFCTTLCMVGTCTILQTAFGIRLPVFQGPSSSFLVPLLALQRDSSWMCEPSKTGEENDMLSGTVGNTTFGPSTATLADHSRTDLTPDMSWRLQTMSGSLMVAALVEVLLGGLGLIKLIVRFVGPITVACTVSLIGVSLANVPLVYGRPCFPVTIGCAMLVVIFVLYCKDVTLPIPRCGKESKDEPNSRIPIFQLIPILLAIIAMWAVVWILTLANVFTDDKDDVEYLARTDAKLPVIGRSQWFQITYPGQFGQPRVHPAVIIGFLVAFVTSMIESIGDYYAAQKACCVPRPPDHAICRGILVEGLGSVLSGSVGAGHATTSYSGNIALLSVSKTASRYVMYTAGILLVGLSLLGKVGAALTSVPNPVLGGVVAVLTGTIFSIGMENLNHVDMTASRNMVVVGLPFMCGIMVPKCLEMYPGIIDTGVSTVDQVLKVMLGMPMFIGGSLALFLDNTVPGSLESRGMAGRDQATDEESDLTETEHELDAYSWRRSILDRALKLCPPARQVLNRHPHNNTPLSDLPSPILSSLQGDTRRSHGHRLQLLLDRDNDSAPLLHFYLSALNSVISRGFVKRRKEKSHAPRAL